MKFHNTAKYVSLMLAILILFSTVSLGIGRISAMPLDEPLLYYNDSTWAREDRSPLKVIENEYYVPLVIFAQLDDTKVRVNNNLNTFVISHGDLYISFDATTDIAIDQDGTYFYARTYKLDYGERYVPAVFVCENLDFGCEMYTNQYTKATSLRITDGTEDLSFDELLELYNPEILKESEATDTEKVNSEADTTEDTTQVTKDTTNQTTDRQTSASEKVTDKQTSTPSISDSTTDVPPVKPLGNRIIYITIDSGINANTGKILDTLSEYGYKATFFIDKAHITDYPLTIARIISEGHNLGLKPGTADVKAYTDTDSFIAELDAANELLYRVYKTKTRTVRPDVLAYSNYALINDISSGKLSEHGYKVWQATLQCPDGMKYDDAAITDIVDAIRENNTLVLGFGSNASTATVLSGVLDFIAEHADKCDVRLADSPYIPPIS